MKLRDALDSIVPDPSAAHVYGQPYQTPDGATVLPVAKVRGRTRPGAEELGEFSPGIYILALYKGEHREFHKIVLEN